MAYRTLTARRSDGIRAPAPEHNSLRQESRNPLLACETAAAALSVRVTARVVSQRFWWPLLTCANSVTAHAGSLAHAGGGDDVGATVRWHIESARIAA